MVKSFSLCYADDDIKKKIFNNGGINKHGLKRYV